MECVLVAHFVTMETRSPQQIKYPMASYGETTHRPFSHRAEEQFSSEEILLDGWQDVAVNFEAKEQPPFHPHFAFLYVHFFKDKLCDSVTLKWKTEASLQETIAIKRKRYIRK